MRSLELELEGFTSFRSRQNLDFSNLDLFAITGPTGAGKTSLLDAITFALYGHVARFGKDATAKELVSQGKENLKVSFHFSIRSVEYRVTRTWRKRPKTEESKALLEMRENDTWEKLETKEKGVSKRVEQILGMDFDTFTRVILLPQGKFDEFIKGKKDKRRDILRELAGFEIFERMRKQAQEQANRLNNEHKFVQLQLEELQVPTANEFTEKQQELENIQLQLSNLSETILKAQKALNEEEELYQKSNRIASLQKDLDKLNIKTPEIENLKFSLQQAQAVDQIKGQFALVQDATERQKQTQSILLLAQKRLTEATKELEKQKAKLDEITAYQQAIEPQIKEREQSLNSARNYEQQQQQHQAELGRAKINQNQRHNNLANLVQTLNDIQNQLKTANKQAEDTEKILTQYSPGGTRLQQLQQASSLLGTWNVIQTQTIKSREKLETNTLEIEQTQKAYENAEAKLKQAQTTLKEQLELLQKAEENNEKLIQSNHAAALREILHDGDNCPVCNGTYLEAQLQSLPKISQIDVSDLRQQKISAEKTQQMTEKVFTKAETNLDNFKKKDLELSQELTASEASLAELREQITLILQEHSWEAEALNQEMKILQDNDTKYHQELAKQKDAVTLVRAAQQALESTQNSHDVAASEYETATQEVKRWQELLHKVETKLYEITGGKSYAELHAALEQEKQTIKQNLQEITDSYQALEKSMIQYKTEEKEARNSAETASSQKQELQTTWEITLKNRGFTETTFLSAQADSAQQANWQKDIENYTNEKIQLQTLVEEVKSQIGTRTTDESTIKSLRDSKFAADKQLQQTENQRTNLLVWMQNASFKQQQAEKLQADVSIAQKQAETYSILARNLRNDEFQAYILEYLEAELVTRATNVLQELTDSRYTLKIQDGDYWVEDNWNGGELRRVQTLSGGETFATSLSMALALSEKLSMGAELGSLFLDEGFGTLDADTLESVTQILESLRQQDKLIGIITHVKALGERLPTQVKVRKSPEGSKIEIEAF
jgi:DNA repair protein SbcC/Rad50